MDDPMVEAIAQSSPSGSMSKRARKAAQERLKRELFGNGLERTLPKQPDGVEILRRRAAELRDLAERGMKPRAYRKAADALELRAQELEARQRHAASESSGQENVE